MEQRSTWTDARLDDRFDRVDRDLADLRAEVRGLRTDTQTGFAELRQSMFRMSISLWAGVIALLAAIIARGG
jgi:hypothetical protein